MRIGFMSLIFTAAMVVGGCQSNHASSCHTKCQACHKCEKCDASKKCCTKDEHKCATKPSEKHED